MHRLGLSVVIPSLNSPLIDQVLDALRRQEELPQEILVVGLDSHGLVQEDGLVRLISTGRPASPAAARNLGARLAQGDIICFTDADCIARPDWLACLLRWHMSGYEIVGGGVAVEEDDYWRLCDNLVAFTPFIERTSAGPRPYLPSLNLSIRRSILEEFGGFDERFPFASGEDTDLSFRLRRAGYTLWFDPHATVIHRHLRSSPGALWRHLYMFGKVYLEIYPRYPDLLGNWLRLAVAARVPDMLPAMAPGLALTDLLKRLVRDPWLWSYWQATPGFLLGKVAWYYGAASTMRAEREERRKRRRSRDEVDR